MFFFAFFSFIFFFSLCIGAIIRTCQQIQFLLSVLTFMMRLESFRIWALGGVASEKRFGYSLHRRLVLLEGLLTQLPVNQNIPFNKKQTIMLYSISFHFHFVVVNHYLDCLNLFGVLRWSAHARPESG